MFRINAARIRQLMFERELTITRLARATKLNMLTVRKIVKDSSVVRGAIPSAPWQSFSVSTATS